MSVLKLIASAVFFGLITIISFCLMLPFIVLKLLPVQALRVPCSRAITAVADGWCVVSQWWIDAINPVQWRIQLPEGLDRRSWYLVIGNHQSWVDILVLQKVFTGRVPFLKFFIKQQLMYVPLLGIVWWAMDFPFMRRSGGENTKKDLEAARKACEKFRILPTSVINFVEGSRFTTAKHSESKSPYAHLLSPKAAGVAVTLESMGPLFASLLDVTIAYPQGVPSFADVMAGRLQEVVVHVRALPLPAELLPRQGQPPVSRTRVQRWVNALWQEKDAELARMLGS
ncbi:MAG: acyltransferase [Brachymonas sp.]|nr:acyltransferase [Brachymonas sp.]